MGTGSLRFKHGKYYFIIKYKDEYGVTKQVERAGTKNKAETTKMMNKMIVAIDEEYQPNTMTIEHYSKLFLDVSSESCKPTTINRYKSLINKYVIPSVGKLRLDTAKSWHFKRIFDTADCSNSTKQVLFDLIKLMYKKAFKLRLVTYNPLDYLDRPKRDKHKLDVFTAEEFNSLLEYVLDRASDYRYYIQYLYLRCMVELGCRRGELNGLAWDCIDLDNNTISIKRNLIYDNGYVGLTTPKTVTGFRDISISDNLCKLLQQHKIVINKNKLLLGTAYKQYNFDVSLVFVWQDGSYVHPDYMLRQFTKLQLALGWTKHYRLHDIRHFNATQLVANNIDVKTVQARLGHSDISTTLNVYVHPLKAKQQDAVDVITDVINK